MKATASLFLVTLLAACVASPARSPEEELAALRDEVTALREAVQRVDNRLSYVQSRVEAASPENEFTGLTIEWVLWEGPEVGMPAQSDPRTLLCRPVEWRGFGKLLRFTRLADPVFYLEAEGAPAVLAHAAEGGITSSDGSTRFVSLSLDAGLQPGVTYRLRPRNENERYRWAVREDVAVKTE